MEDRRVHRALAYLATIALLGASSTSRTPPPTPDAFIASFKSAINAKNKAAVDRLVYWGGADAWSRSMTESILSIYEAETIASAHLAPLDKSVADTFVGPNGVKYGPSMKPVFSVVLEYAHGPNVTQDEGSFVIGSKDGGWYIVAMAPVR